MPPRIFILSWGFCYILYLYMIYGLTSWEKLNTLAPTIFINGNVVVSQRTKLFTSHFAYVIAAFLILYGILPLGGYFVGVHFSLSNIQPTDVFSLVSIVIGIVLIFNARTGIALRNEQGGIHPTDTLTILDSSTKTVTQQIGTITNSICNFSDLRLELHLQKNSRSSEYVIVAFYPSGKINLGRGKNRLDTERVLQEIKTRLQIA